MKKSHVHLIGIGGAGLSAIARVLHERGHVVSGSDRALSSMAAALQDEGIKVSVGHDVGLNIIRQLQERIAVVFGVFDFVVDGRGAIP